MLYLSVVNILIIIYACWDQNCATEHTACSDTTHQSQQEGIAAAADATFQCLCAAACSSSIDTACWQCNAISLLVYLQLALQPQVSSWLMCVELIRLRI